MNRSSAPVIQITMADFARASAAKLLARSDVPDPPTGAPRNYGGEVPYKNGGYVIDVGKHRWRFDRHGLMGFMVYGPRRKIKKFWSREGSY
jgi:hypothetical protein